MSDNPYAVTDVDQFKATHQIEVDGDCIVVHSPAELPARCIISNVPTPSNHARLRWNLTWKGKPFRLQLRRKYCDLTFSATRRVRLRTNANGLADLLMIPAFALLAIAYSDGISGLVLLGLIAILVGLFAWLRVVAVQLKVVDHRDGRFWIRGCSPEFLDQLSNEVNEIDGLRELR